MRNGESIEPDLAELGPKLLRAGGQVGKIAIFACCGSRYSFPFPTAGSLYRVAPYTDRRSKSGGLCAPFVSFTEPELNFNLILEERVGGAS